MGRSVGFCAVGWAVLVVGCGDSKTEPKGSRETPAASAPAPAPGRGVSQKMFADDVAADELALSISIETIGGVASPIMRRGTKLPARHVEVFSTGTDNQVSVEVHVLQGERPLASQNRSLGRFQLVGIPLARRGVPQIEVTFAVDDRGVLSVAARDLATDRVKEIHISGMEPGALDRASVDRMLAEAQAANADDQAAAAFAKTRLELDSLIAADRQLLEDTGHKLSPPMRAKLARELDRAESVLRTATEPSQRQLLSAAKQALETVGHDAASELYANSK